MTFSPSFLTSQREMTVNRIYALGKTSPLELGIMLGEHLIQPVHGEGNPRGKEKLGKLRPGVERQPAPDHTGSW